MMNFGMLWGVISIIGMLAIAGIALLLWSLRGKRIGDHPVCRRCDFDLTGLPKESGRCPECGSDLSRKRGIGIGHRRRRPVLAALATLMILPAPGGVGAIGWMLATGRDLSQYEPAWLLRFSAIHLDATTSDAALRELMSRAAMKKLTRPQVDQIVADALKIQADDHRRWSPLWGDFIERASWLKLLSDDDWARYYVRTVETSLVLDVRGKVRRGDALPLRFSSVAGRGGTRTSINAARTITRITVDNGTVVFDPRDQRSPKEGPFGTGAPNTSVIWVTPWKLDGVADGPHAVTVDFLVATPKIWPGQRVNRPLSVTRSWTLVPADVLTVTPHDEPGLKPAIARAIRVASAVGDGESLKLTIDVSDSPVDISFLVYARYDGIESQVGSFAAPPTTTTRVAFSGQARGFNGRRLDLILRSDPAAALRTTDVTQAWVGEIELKDIPVRQQSPRALPLAHPFELAPPRL